MQDRAQFGAQYSRWEVVAGVGLKLGKNDVSSLVEGSQILGFKRPTDETTIGESVAKHDAWRVLFFQNRTPLRAGREEGCAGAKEQLGSMAIAAQHLRQDCDGSGLRGCVAMVDKFRGCGRQLIVSVG